MSGKAARNIKPTKDDRRSKKFSIIIPSAGEGSRIRSLGPRSLIQLPNGKTLVEHQISILKDTFPLSDFILVSGFEATRLMNKAPLGTICVENERYNETNVLRSIGIGLRASLNDNVLIVYGDLVFNRNTLDFPINKSCIVYSNEPAQQSENEVGCTIYNNQLENIYFGLPNKWIGMVYLEGRELRLMKNISFDKQKEKLYGWEGINYIIEKEGRFGAYCPDGSKSIDIDTSKDLDKISGII